MKKIFKLFTLSLLFFASCTMTVAEDIVAKEYFETTNISKISTDLTVNSSVSKSSMKTSPLAVFNSVVVGKKSVGKYK